MQLIHGDCLYETGRIRRLPKWAQRHISDLQMCVVGMQVELACLRSLVPVDTPPATRTSDGWAPGFPFDDHECIG